MSIQIMLLSNYERLKNNKYYLKQLKNHLICPNCFRNVSNKDFFYKKGCKWCQKP